MTGSTDTTVQVKWSTSEHPELKTPENLASIFSQFGVTDTEHIAVILKPPKKNPTKPPKHGSALVPFKKIGDAFAAVCSSNRPERGLKGIDIGWVGGKEPPILNWLKQNGLISMPPPKPTPSSAGRQETRSVSPAAGAGQGVSGPFSSFPSTFVRIHSSSFMDHPLTR